MTIFILNYDFTSFCKGKVFSKSLENLIYLNYYWPKNLTEFRILYLTCKFLKKFKQCIHLMCNDTASTYTFFHLKDLPFK